MAIKTINKWGFTTPITSDAAIEAAFGGMLNRVADEANKALNALSEEVDTIRRDPRYTPAGKDAACVAAAKQAIADLESATANPRKAIAEAIDRAKSNVPTAAQLPRPENVWIGGDARIVEARASEIRQSLSAMNAAERAAAITVGFRSQDHEMAWAIVGAPPIVRQSLFPDAAGLESLVGQYIAQRYPERFATYGTAINAKRIVDGIIGQARDTAKTLSGAPARFDGPNPTDNTADAAYKQPFRRLNGTGEYVDVNANGEPVAA
jgi:hypothetical protein